MARVGPSEAARRRADEAKSAAKAARIDRVTAAVVSLQHDVDSGGLDRSALRHEDVYSAAGVSKASYFRFIEASPQLKSSVRALLSRPAAPDAKSAEITETVELSLHRLRESSIASKAIIQTLMEQLAACKVYVISLELELAAKKKEVKSKDGSIHRLQSQLKYAMAMSNQRAEMLAAAGIDDASVLSGSKAGLPLSAKVVPLRAKPDEDN